MLSTGNQLRAARSLVGMDQGTLAQSAGVNINTVSSMEKKGGENLTSALDKVRSIMSVLEAEGVEFLNHGEPGVRIRSWFRVGDRVKYRLRERELNHHQITEAQVGIVAAVEQAPIRMGPLPMIQVRFGEFVTPWESPAQFDFAWRIGDRDKAPRQGRWR